MKDPRKVVHRAGANGLTLCQETADQTILKMKLKILTEAGFQSRIRTRPESCCDTCAGRKFDDSPSPVPTPTLDPKTLPLVTFDDLEVGDTIKHPIWGLLSLVTNLDPTFNFKDSNGYPYSLVNLGTKYRLTHKAK